jgi:hypothetical protein
MKHTFTGFSHIGAIALLVLAVVWRINWLTKILRLRRFTRMRPWIGVRGADGADQAG